MVKPLVHSSLKLVVVSLAPLHEGERKSAPQFGIVNMMLRRQKAFLCLTLVFSLLIVGNTGCATQALLRETKPKTQVDRETGESKEIPGNKRAYVALPFAVAFDIVSLPFVGIYFGWCKLIGYNG